MDVAGPSKRMRQATNGDKAQPSMEIAGPSTPLETSKPVRIQGYVVTDNGKDGPKIEVFAREVGSHGTGPTSRPLFGAALAAACRCCDVRT